MTRDTEDIHVLTAVPKQSLGLVMRKGLASQKAISEDPEMTEAFLRQRGIEEEAWREELASDLKKSWRRDSRLGPSVFFTPPDPDKVSDPRHFINKFDTSRLRVNLSKLMRDVPETRIQGVELIPAPENFKTMSDAEWDVIAKQRKRDLTPEEVTKYTATDPKEIWKHYKDEYIGKYYAADVPHAFIRTPSGIIPPEYLERVTHADDRLAERTSLPPSVLRDLRRRVASAKLPRGNHHVKLDDESYAVLKDVGAGKRKKHVVATVLASHMRRPGSDVSGAVYGKEATPYIKAASVNSRDGRRKKMYHGSNAKFDRFEPKAHLLSGDERVVFGTPLRSMAVAGMGRWTDDDFEQGTYNDEELLHMRELKPGALESIYRGKRGYLYEMDPESFEHGGDAYMPTEYISKTSPKILKRTEVDAYEAMLAEEKAGRMKIHRMQKGAALNTDVKLRPHQEAALGVLGTGGRAIFAHGTGTGKTLTSIAAFERLRERGEAKRALVVAPASLLTNFREQGVKKFTNSSVSAVGGDGDYQLVSLEKFRRDPDEVLNKANADTLIVDEIHRSRNPRSSSFESLRTATRDKRIKNAIGLTGSLVSNHPKDIVPLADIIHGQHDLGSPGGFTSKHVDTKRISGGFLKPPTTKYNLTAVPALRDKMEGMVHYVGHQDMQDMPSLDIKDVNVEMSPEQQKLYDFAMGKLNAAARARIRSGLPPSQTEAKHIFSVITKLRQASNSVGTHKRLDPAEAAEQTPKLKRALDDVQKHLEDTPDGQAVLYSNLVRGGANELYRGLEARGIPVGIYSGVNKELGITKETRDKAVSDFLTRKNRAIVLTGAGGEGISLNNATFFGAVDPHFNPERNWQAVARARRFGGLSHRKKEDRVVDVRRYRSEPIQSWLGKKVFGREVGVDEWMQRVADEKDRLNEQMRDVSARGMPKTAGSRLRNVLFRKFVDPLVEDVESTHIGTFGKQVRDLLDFKNTEALTKGIEENREITRRGFLRKLVGAAIESNLPKHESSYFENLAAKADPTHLSHGVSGGGRELVGTALGGPLGALITNTGALPGAQAVARPIDDAAVGLVNQLESGTLKDSVPLSVRLSRVLGAAEAKAKDIEELGEAYNSGGRGAAIVEYAKQRGMEHLDEHARRYGSTPTQVAMDHVVEGVLPMGRGLTAVNRALRKRDSGVDRLAADRQVLRSSYADNDATIGALGRARKRFEEWQLAREMGKVPVPTRSLKPSAGIHYTPPQTKVSSYIRGVKRHISRGKRALNQQMSRDRDGILNSYVSSRVGDMSKYLQGRYSDRETGGVRERRTYALEERYPQLKRARRARVRVSAEAGALANKSRMRGDR